MKHHTKLIVVNFFLGLVLLLPQAALADTHGIQGCLYVMDTRSDSPDDGNWVPVPELPIKVWFTDILGFEAAASGTLTTNSSGCFSGTLSGFTVPEDTTIKVGALTQNSDWMVSDDNWPYFVYNYQFTNSDTVAKGETADFGDMGISDSLGDDHGVFLLFQGMAKGIELYEDKTGESWTGYQDVGVRFPSAGSPFSSGNPSWADPVTGIHITTNGNTLATFFHEWGHWLGFNDSSTVVLLPNYCTDYSGAAYPFNIDPYTYTDPGRPNCGHSGYYESSEVANIEGYAEFYADFLLSKTGDFDATFDARGLSFWGQNQETNVTYALLDLVDANNESVTYRHAYQNSGSTHLREVSGSTPVLADYGKQIGANATHAFGPSATDEYGIYKFPLSYGGTATAVYTGLSFKPQIIAVDLNRGLCVFGDDLNLYCGATTGRLPLTKVAMPTVGTYPYTYTVKFIDDMVMIAGELFISTRNDGIGETKILRGSKTTTTKFSLPTWSWSEVYAEAADEDIYDIAVDTSKSELFIGGLARDSGGEIVGWKVESCSLATTPCVPTLLLGSTTQYGYKRGTASQTLLSGMNDLIWANNYLYIVDNYGVSRYSKTSGALEQYFDTDEDSYTFQNNLHRLSYDGDTDFNFFVTNGTQSLAQTDSDTLYIDDSQPTTVEYYCGTDTATLPAKDVVHMYRSVGAYGGDFITDLANINGMTASLQEGVSQINWLTLNKSQECPAWEDFVKIDGGSGATATATIPAEEDDSTSGACIGEDDEQEQQYQSGQEKPAPLKPITTESITVDDEDKTYPSTTPISGS